MSGEVSGGGDVAWCGPLQGKTGAQRDAGEGLLPVGDQEEEEEEEDEEEEEEEEEKEKEGDRERVFVFVFFVFNLLL